MPSRPAHVTGAKHGRNRTETRTSIHSHEYPERSLRSARPAQGATTAHTITGGSMFTSADDLLAYVKDEGVEIIDVRFCDLPGIMQHFTVPAGSFGPEIFEDGLAFDGSSIRGFQKIHESDMALLPDPTTAYLDPFRIAKTLCINFFVHDPLTKEPYSRDPRNIARKAENYLASTGIGDTAFFAPGGRVLRLRRRAVRDQAEHRLLRDRLRGRRLEHRPGRGGRQPRLQGALQGRLLPGPAGRPLLRPARRDDQEPGGLRADRSSGRTTRWAPRARRRSTIGSTPC